MIRSCLVTGAASGLGEATAALLAEAGWTVGALDLPGKKSEALGSLANVLQYEADILDEKALQKCLVALNQAAPLRGVVHCAGVAFAATTLGKHGPHPTNAFEWVLNTNILGSFKVARMSAEVMAGNVPEKGGARGCIVLTASVAAFDGQRGQVAYAASKGAVASMVLPMARDLARHGIRVNAIAPGIFDTPMMGMLPEEKREQLAAHVTFPKELGDPRHYAEFAQSVLSNHYLNGEVIRLDGGIRLP